MYYSNGNYEAFARPKKPEGVDDKNAYIIGTGLAALTAACYLVRDAQMPGSHIHVFEKDAVPGGACDGANIPGIGYVMRGGREMDNHFEVMWDMFRSIPSIETEGVSVLDEYYWLNKEDPNFSLCRSTKARGVDAGTNGKFNLSDKASMEIMKLFLHRMRNCTARKFPIISTTKSSIRISGCTGAPCSLLKIGIVRWK
mgnify:CR=1 FL=1